MMFTFDSVQQPLQQGQLSPPPAKHNTQPFITMSHLLLSFTALTFGA